MTAKETARASLLLNTEGKLIWSYHVDEGKAPQCPRTYAELSESLRHGNIKIWPNTVRFFLGRDTKTAKRKKAGVQMQTATMIAFPLLATCPVVTLPSGGAGARDSIDVDLVDCGLSITEFIEKATDFKILGKTLGPPSAIGSPLAAHEAVILIDNVYPAASQKICQDLEEVLREQVNREPMKFELKCRAIFEVRERRLAPREHLALTAQLLLLIHVYARESDALGRTALVEGDAAAAARE